MLFSQALPINHLFLRETRSCKAKCLPIVFSARKCPRKLQWFHPSCPHREPLPSSSAFENEKALARRRLEITRKEVVLSEVCSVRCCSMCKQGFCLSAVKSMGEFAEKYWRDIGEKYWCNIVEKYGCKICENYGVNICVVSIGSFVGGRRARVDGRTHHRALGL